MQEMLLEQYSGDMGCGVSHSKSQPVFMRRQLTPQGDVYNTLYDRQACPANQDTMGGPRDDRPGPNQGRYLGSRRRGH